MSLMGTSSSSTELSDLELLVLTYDASSAFNEANKIIDENDEAGIDPFESLYQDVLASTDPLLWEAFIENTESMSLLTKEHYATLLLQLQHLIQVSMPLHKPWLTLLAVYTVKAHPIDYAVLLGKRTKQIEGLFEIAIQKIHTYAQSGNIDDNIQVVKWLNFMLAFQDIPKGLPLLLQQSLFQNPLPFEFNILGPHLLFQLLKLFPKQYTDSIMQHIRAEIDQCRFTTEPSINKINVPYRRLVSIVKLLYAEPRFNSLLRQDPQCLLFILTLDLNALPQKTPSTLLKELERAKNETSLENDDEIDDKNLTTEAAVVQESTDFDVELVLVDDGDMLLDNEASPSQSEPLRRTYNETTPLLLNPPLLEKSPDSGSHHPAVSFLQRLFVPCFRGCFGRKSGQSDNVTEFRDTYRNTL